MLVFVVYIIVPRLGTNFILYSIAMYKFTLLNTKGWNNRNIRYIDLCGR